MSFLFEGTIKKLDVSWDTYCLQRHKSQTVTNQWHLENESSTCLSFRTLTQLKNRESLFGCTIKCFYALAFTLNRLFSRSLFVFHYYDVYFTFNLYLNLNVLFIDCYSYDCSKGKLSMIYISASLNQLHVNDYVYSFHQQYFSISKGYPSLWPFLQI